MNEDKPNKTPEQELMDFLTNNEAFKGVPGVFKSPPSTGKLSVEQITEELERRVESSVSQEGPEMLMFRPGMTEDEILQRLLDLQALARKLNPD